MTTVAKPSPIRVALVQHLRSDAVLMELCTGVYAKVAPSKAIWPYVLVVPMNPTGTGEFSFSDTDEPLVSESWLVKGVGVPEAAEAIAARCKELLRRATLEIEGYSCKYLEWQHNVDFPEVVQGERHDHVGAVYTLVTEKE